MDKQDGMSLVLLLAAIGFLYLAVTGKMNRLLDAWDILMGSKTACASTALASTNTSAGNPLATNISVSLPSLPSLTNAQVPA
jgi:hypothetical protein